MVPDIKSSAIALARRGLPIFPCVPNSKVPAIKDFSNRATTDEAQIELWWNENPFYNIGIAMGRGLIAVDIDVKDGISVEEKILKLELEGKELPKTLVQKTQSGGAHYIYRCDTPLRQGAHVFGRNVDLRAEGGFIVGAGSVFDGRTYSISGSHLADCPAWVIESRRIQPESKTDISNLPVATQVDGRMDRVWAQSRAVQYLREEALPAVEGAGGDETTYKVVCRLKDYGLTPQEAYDLLVEEYNPRCSPPWDGEQLLIKIRNAFQYGGLPAGIKNPSVHFDIIPAPPKELSPIEKMNENYAFVIDGGRHHILFETKNEDGYPITVHLNEEAFHRKFQSKMHMHNGKLIHLTKLWMSSENRRSFDGYVFSPGKPLEFSGYYNTWRGWTVAPYASEKEASANDKRSLSMLLAHCLETICLGDRDHFNWVMGFFANIFQKPQEKNLVALVLKGGKGTGKTSFIDFFAHLLGSHYSTNAHKRFLMGNFNSHLETNLLSTFEEAFWSGDKQAEGILKDLITGTRHSIEPKGKEAYTVKNMTRVVIIGNEEWLVPASADERRFAVFDLGPKQLRDNAFFEEMRLLMEAGGYRLLLRYLLDFDLSKVDLNTAPKTQALSDQKAESLPALQQFWHDCLMEGEILHSHDGSGKWPSSVSKKTLRYAFKGYCTERNIRTWSPSERAFGKAVFKLFPKTTTLRVMEDGVRQTQYGLPPLPEARAQFEKATGIKEDWTDL